MDSFTHIANLKILKKLAKHQRKNQLCVTAAIPAQKNLAQVMLILKTGCVV